jgi:hypothetical protein
MAKILAGDVHENLGRLEILGPPCGHRRGAAGATTTSSTT